MKIYLVKSFFIGIMRGLKIGEKMDFQVKLFYWVNVSLKMNLSFISGLKKKRLFDTDRL